MKLAVPFEVRIFLVVMLVSIISVLVILDTPVPEQGLTSQVIQGLQQPGEPSNTLIISGIDIGQNIGAKSPTVSGNEFACFADQRIFTDRGRATARYFLSLYDSTNGGCTVEFAETEEDKTGLFMRCRSAQKAYDYTIRFEPSLDSDMEDGTTGELEDIIGEHLNIFGYAYEFVKATATTATNTIRIRLIGPTGTLDLEDNYADTAFSDKVRANGKDVLDARVRIRATATSDTFSIISIEYIFFPQAKTGKDVYVPDHQGLKQHLRSPEGMLGDFDLLFVGVGTAPPRVSTPRPTPSVRYGGNVIAFDAVGDDTYNMVFNNNRGQRYAFPLMTVEGGALKYGDEDQDFIFQGAGAAYNIDVNDYFAVTDRATRTGVTAIIKYSSIDFAQGQIYFTDLAGGQTVGRFDTTTGASTQPAILGGGSFIFEVDVTDPAYPIRFDHDGNGVLGGEAEIVTAGGVRVDFAAGGTGAIEVDENLFADEAPAGGETINFAFAKEGSDIDVDISSGVTLIKNDANGKREGLTQFGIFVQRGNRDSANDLVFSLPGGQRTAVITTGPAYSPGGQAQGAVLVTCERSEFVKRAQAAKKKS